MAYIDGFNLYHGLKANGWRRFYWLNVWRLAESLLPSGGMLVGVNYYTAIVASHKGDPDKTRRQTTFIDALRTVPKLQIVLGHYLKKTITCNYCNRSWTSYEEKCTDVNMACQMLIDSYEDRFDTLLLISADADLMRPLTRIRESFGTRKTIIVAFPPSRGSAELKRSADICLHIDQTHLRKSQFPDQVASATGYLLQRPASWR